MLKEFIEKQYFIVNLDTLDIADAMVEDGDKTEEEIASRDVEYVNVLLNEDDLTIKKFEGSSAIIKFDREERTLHITHTYLHKSN